VVLLDSDGEDAKTNPLMSLAFDILVLMGTRPTTRHGIDKNGECGLCPHIGRLSDTHIPPECAGNTEEFQPMVFTRVDRHGQGATYEPGRVKEGGVRGYFLCVDCNGIASKYDAEWPRWLDAIRAQVMTQRRPALGTTLPLTVQEVRPGAFLRSVLAGMFGIKLALKARWPTVVDAIRNGSPTAPPDDFWFGMTLADGFPHVEGGSGVMVAAPIGTRPSLVQLSSGLLTTDGYIEEMPYAVIGWPPLSFVVHDVEHSAVYPHQNFASWLADDPADVRDVDLLLKVVRRRPDRYPTVAASFGW